MKAEQQFVHVVDERGEVQRELPVGSELRILAEGLRPSTAHSITVSDDDGDLFVDTVLSDGAGSVGPTIIWPLVGLEDPRDPEPVSVAKAVDRWRHRELRLVVRAGKRIVSETGVLIGEARQPIVVHTDAKGRLLNGFEVGDHPASVLLLGLDDWPAARVFMVPRQHQWIPGDAIRPVALGRRHAVRDAKLREGRPTRVVVAKADELEPGAYDFVVRRLRYGYDDDDDLFLRPEDLVAGRHITGLVVRERFMPSKVIKGGCANLQRIAGRRINEWPYIEFTDVFQVGETIWGALDPSALDPNHTGKMVALYVVPHKSASEWTASSSLQHLAVLGGNGSTQRFLTQSYCVNANLRQLWANATDVGAYDVVADFGNNSSDPLAFVPDDSYDMPLDLIDGYINPGFRVVQDPTVDTSFAHAGAFSYTQPAETFADDGGLSWNVPITANVRFPADASGATDPSQISAAAPSYPVVVCVHGNSGHLTSYQGYDYLLDHLAKNGFIAASIHCAINMNGSGRARLFRRHVELLFAKFGAKAANNVGMMGHSRGGEAVAQAIRLNNQEAWGINLAGGIALAPTDQYTSETLAPPWATPYMVIYGSLDGDVAGNSNNGFRIYDRASGADKTMAFVYGACHGRFNTVWGDADVFTWKLTPTDRARIISADAHQKIAKGYMSAFFRRYLKGEVDLQGVLEGEWVPAAVSASTPGLKVVVQHEPANASTIDSFEGAHTPTSWQTSTVGGAVTQTGLVVAPAEDHLPTLDVHSPHDTAGLQLQWDSALDALQLDLPAGQQNVSARTVVSFRVTQKVDSPANPANQAQDLRVALVDGTGMARSIRVSKLGEIPFPDVREVHQFSKSSLGTVRIPLAAYTIRCLGVPSVNLADVRSIRFELDERPTGEIQIDTIQFS